MTSKPSLPTVLVWGIFQGAAAWSAYALIEFVVSSILFGILRPYAVFTPWHWQLTGLLVIGFLAAGCAAGALAALILWFARRDAIEDGAPALLEHASGLTVSLAFLTHLSLGAQDTTGRGWLIAFSALICALQFVALVSERWRERTGFLPHYWISSALILGVGTELQFRAMGVAGQLGVRLAVWSWALVAAMVATAAAAVMLGRKLESHTGLIRRIASATVASAIVLFAASEALSMSGKTPSVEAAAGTVGSATRPNVLVIVMDTVRADHLSLYGYGRDTTPNLKALARDAAVYPNAVSASDITLTSHGSLFTGMYASWHGAYCDKDTARYGHALNPQYPTLAELVKPKGYSTLAVAANMYLRADFGLERGFDEFQIPRPVTLMPVDTPFLLRRVVRRSISEVFDTKQFDRLFSLAQDINVKLFSTLSAHGGTPFFAFVNYMDAHFPYVPPAPYHRTYSGLKASFMQEDLEDQMTAIGEGADASRAFVDHCLAEYDGGIAYEDAQLGKLVDWLKRHNAYDNTMIVIASDHGEAFGERHRVEHGNSPYQNVVHVALMIKYPRNAHQGVEPAPVSLIDVAPTVLSTLGMTRPATMQGRDLNHPEALRGREIFSESFPCPVMQAPDCKYGCTARSVYAWPYKYVTSSSGKRELFDLSKDPLEEHSIHRFEKTLRAKLRDDLDAWVKTTPAKSTEKHEPTHDDQQRLKSLGYVAK